MRVAYAFHLDAANPAVQSGRPASILSHLTELGASVQRVFPLSARAPAGSSAKKALYRVFGRYYRGDREPGFLKSAAEEIRRRTRETEFDLLFCPGSEAVARLDIREPIAFCADATFANMIDYYWDFSDLASEYVQKGHLQEAGALRRASLAIYPSDWAARSAIEFYHADPSKVFVIPFGANFGARNQRAQVERWIAGRRSDRLRILFVGRSWRRKGGDIAVEVAHHLVAKGLRVTLDVVSGEIPHRLKSMPWIVHHGLLDPNSPASAAILNDLFRGANFVLIPSRAEAYGMAFAEASAFGVPAVGTATGGIPSVIHEGLNGFALPLSAKPSEYAEVIATTFARRERYLELCRSSFAEFERRLNWKIFCTRLLDLAGLCREAFLQKAGGGA